MRTTRRGTERCGLIRKAATDLFLERGYDGVSVDDIIARAGGSKTNVYSYFGGKDGLFVAVVETLCDEINAKLKARDLTGLSLEQGLRVLGSALLAELLQDWHLALYRLVIAESARFPEIGRAWGAHGPETSCRILSDFIASRRPADAPVEPHRAATL
jgi:AcrR family transcriptional regulator